jgi:CRISPR-associated endonuclease Csn1
LRVINKTTNHSEHFEDGKKVLVKQEKVDSWAVRKSMHKDTGWGEVNLRFVKQVSLNEALKRPERIVNKDFKLKIRELLSEGKEAKFIKKYLDENKDVWSDINITKIDVYCFTKETKDRYFATRFMSDLVGYMSGIKEYDKALDKIDGITDTGIQKILKAHLQAKDNIPELAFSADGIDEMNRNIVELNDGKPHKPIYKVRRYESGNKYPIGQIGCKAKKFVEADKGTNLFFSVFVSEKIDKDTGETEKVRSYYTIPLNIMIDCQKEYGSKWHDNIEAYIKTKEKEKVPTDGKLLFILSPNDLVYLPTKEELMDGINVIDKSRIYKMVSSSSYQCFFIDEKVAKSIVDKMEFTSLNKSERAITGEMIKETCVPIKVDRLGNIIEINDKKL